MANVNYKSDFKLFEEGCDFIVPFLFEYRTVFDRQYVASHVDGIYTNCQLQEDGRLLVVFDDHNLPPGILTCTRHFYLSDQDFHDGICDLWDKRDTGIILTTNRTDCCEVSIELPPFYMQGEAGTTPHIGENGNWYIGNEDTGVLAKGKDGSNGKTPVFVSGTVTTLQPNTSATGNVESDGISEDGNPKYKINLGIPRGEKGESGTDGTNGADGKTPIFESGTASSVDSSAQPSIDITSNGTDTDGNPKYLVNVSIPKGQKGDTGEQGPKGEQGVTGSAGTDGEDGKTPVLEIGQTSTLDPGSSAIASLIPDGTDLQGNPKYKLNLGIPQGEKGEEGSIIVGLSELSDVTIESLQDNQILISNGGKWANANLSDYVSTDLDSISDLDDSWKSLLQEEKPTTLSGYGITNGIEGVSLTGNGNVVTSYSITNNNLELKKDFIVPREFGRFTGNDFNDITESGIYEIHIDHWGSNAPSEPTQKYGLLLAFKGNINQPVVQIYIPHLKNYGIQYREKYEAEDVSWQSWKTLLDETNYTSFVKKIGTDTIGSSLKPIYLNSGVPTPISDTVGSSSNPVYLSSGTITKCNSTIGSSAKPVYMNAGTIRELSSTVGSSSRPVYLSSGTITQCSYTFGNSSGNAAISNGTVCKNLNADMIDGFHNGELEAKSLCLASNDSASNLNNLNNNGIYFWSGAGTGTPENYGVLFQFSNGSSPSSSSGWGWIYQLAATTTHNLYFRSTVNGGSFQQKQIAFSSSSSDIRLKDKLSDINLDTKEIAKAPFFSFKWKDGRQKIEIGSTAQFWRSIIPEAVEEDNEGFLSMAYDRIALASAISIAKEVINLNKRVADIERIMNKL